MENKITCLSRFLLCCGSGGGAHHAHYYVAKDRQDSTTYPLLLKTYAQRKPKLLRQLGKKEISDNKISSCCSRTSPIIGMLRWIPVLFVALIFLWSCYAYIYHFCLRTLLDHLETATEFNQGHLFAFAYATTFSLLFLLMVTCYLTVTLLNRYAIPPNYKLREGDLKELEAAVDVETIGRILWRVVREQIGEIKMVSADGGPRYCDTCKCIKPDRAHHCISCGKCILKMDHHCPWINNCVQFGNYKQFILLLMYGLSLCVFALATIFPYFISYWSNNSSNLLANITIEGDNREEVNGNFASSSLETNSESNIEAILKALNFDKDSFIKPLLSTRFNVLFLFFVALIFGTSLGALLSYHCLLISKNRTTLESFSSPLFIDFYDEMKPENAFDLGTCRQNFMQVFGHSKIYWLLPIFSGVGRGIKFPTRNDIPVV